MESAGSPEQPKAGDELETNSGLSASKIETIALLNDSIDRLEQTIKGISENSLPMPSSDSITTLLNTTQELAGATTPVSNVSKPSDSEIKSTHITPESPQATSTTDNQPQSAKVEAISPESKSPSADKAKKKSILPLVVIVVTAIAIAAVLWLWLPRREANLAQLPELTVTEIPDTLSSDEATPVPPVLDPTQLKDTPSEIESIDSESETPIVVSIPANLESPGKAKNLKMVAVKPKLDFTPEQTLVAVLQSKIIQLAKEYPSELINSVNTNLPQNTLLVEVSDKWYQLDASSQTQIANQMLEQARQLSFSKLRIEDNSGMLVARNPVIGKQIVILESKKNLD